VRAYFDSDVGSGPNGTLSVARGVTVAGRIIANGYRFSDDRNGRPPSQTLLNTFINCELDFGFTSATGACAVSLVGCFPSGAVVPFAATAGTLAVNLDGSSAAAMAKVGITTAGAVTVTTFERASLEPAGGRE